MLAADGAVQNAVHQTGKKATTGFPQREIKQVYS